MPLSMTFRCTYQENEVENPLRFYHFNPVGPLHFPTMYSSVENEVEYPLRFSNRVGVVGTWSMGTHRRQDNMQHTTNSVHQPQHTTKHITFHHDVFSCMYGNWNDYKYIDADSNVSPPPSQLYYSCIFHGSSCCD